MRSRLGAPRRPALRGARHPASARCPGRPGHRQAARDRRDRHLVRRHPEPQPGAPARPRPPARRLVQAVAQPERTRAANRRRLAALGDHGPDLRAHAERAVPRLRTGHERAEPPARRCHEAELHERALHARNVSGFIAPEGADPTADLSAWRAATDRGEPYGQAARGVARELTTYHSATGVPGKPAPMLVQNGWTDDLFPATEALRVYQTFKRTKGALVSYQFGDLGHPRGSNKVGRRSLLQRPGRGLLRRPPRGQGASARAQRGDRVHADLPQGGPGGGAVPGAQLGAAPSRGGRDVTPRPATDRLRRRQPGDRHRLRPDPDRRSPARPCQPSLPPGRPWRP